MDDADRYQRTLSIWHETAPPVQFHNLLSQVTDAFTRQTQSGDRERDRLAHELQSAQLRNEQLLQQLQQSDKENQRLVHENRRLSIRLERTLARYANVRSAAQALDRFRQSILQAVETAPTGRQSRWAAEMRSAVSEEAERSLYEDSPVDEADLGALSSPVLRDSQVALVAEEAVQAVESEPVYDRRQTSLHETMLNMNLNEGVSDSDLFNGSPSNPNLEQTRYPQTLSAALQESTSSRSRVARTSLQNSNTNNTHASSYTASHIASPTQSPRSATAAPTEDASTLYRQIRNSLPRPQFLRFAQVVADFNGRQISVDETRTRLREVLGEGVLLERMERLMEQATSAT